MSSRIPHLEGLIVVSVSITMRLEIPHHELRVPLGMSRISSAVPGDRRMANALLREVPEDDEEDEDEEKDDKEEDDEEGEGYSE